MRKSSLALAIFGLSAIVGVVVVELRAEPPAPLPTVAQKASAVLSVPLIGDDGQPTTLAAKAAGAWTVLELGYMTCPDVCPTSLAYLGREMTLLGDAAKGVRFVFVSVDPKRDAPDALGRYVRHFDPRLQAVTGTEDDLRALAKHLGAFFDYQKEEGSAAGYTVTHSPAFFVLDPGGRLVEVLSPPHERGVVAGTLRRLATGAH